MLFKQTSIIGSAHNDPGDILDVLHLVSEGKVNCGWRPIPSPILIASSPDWRKAKYVTAPWSSKPDARPGIAP